MASLEAEEQNHGVMWPKPGSHFQGFDLITEIGRGAFGRVFLASEQALGERPVVLKVARQGRQEAEMLARLRHPNIVPVYSVRQDDATGLAGFCMPYLGQATFPPCSTRSLPIAGHPRQARAICGGDPGRQCRPGIARAGRPASNSAYRVIRGGRDSLGCGDRRRPGARPPLRHMPPRPETFQYPAVARGRPLLLDFNLAIEDHRPVWKIGGTLPYMCRRSWPGSVTSRQAAPRRATIRRAICSPWG